MTVRRDILRATVGLTTAVLLPGPFAHAQDAASAAPSPGLGPATSLLPPPRPGPRPGAWLVLLGTRGGPGVDAVHAQTASAVVVDGRPYLIDCGYGALRQLVAANVGYLQISTILFTHLHDDHTGDLPALLSYQWTNGKTTPTDAYGPYGTAHMVEAAVSFFHANVEIRTADEGRTVDADKQFHGHDVVASDTP